MSLVTGKVAVLKATPKTSKAGKSFTIHSVVLDTGVEVETGFNQPFKTGDNFAAECETKYGRLSMVPGGATAAPAPSAGGGGRAPAATGRTFPVATDSPEMSIIRQNSLTNARELWQEVARNHMPPDLAETEAFMADVAEKVLTTAYKFAEFSSGQREVRASKAGV